MRTGAASGTEGHFHETAFYGSDEEFLAIVVPFLTDGVAAGEPTLVSLGEANNQLICSALGKNSGISFVPRGEQYSRGHPYLPRVGGGVHEAGRQPDPPRRRCSTSRIGCGMGVVGTL